jgi:hypothetical protein
VALELVQGYGQAEEVIRKLLASRRQEFLDHWPRFAKQRAAWQRWLEGARQDGTVSAETR